MSAAEKLELLSLLEEKRRRQAFSDLNAYCRYVEIPGAPMVEDSCPDGDDCDNPKCKLHEVSTAFYPDTVEPAEHHKLINDVLMKVERGEICPETGHKYSRAMLFMPPGSAKSTYGSVTFPSWAMGRRRGRNIISTSYASGLAKKFGRKVRSIAKSKQYREVFGAEINRENRAVNDWSLSNTSTYMSGGILSGITGNRADGLVIDDPVKGRQDADSPTVRANTWEAYLTDLRTRLKPNGWIVIIQTRWHEDDLSGRILPDDYDGQSGWVQAKDGEWWYVISLQAQAERKDDPLGRDIGDWLWTDWFTPDHWEQEKVAQGERNWSALYQQRPKPPEGAIIKRAWPIRYRLGELPPDAYFVHSWDTASKADEITNDPSVCSVWAISRLGYYLVHVYRGWLLYPELKAKVKGMAEMYPPNAVLIEDKSSGQSLIQDLRNESLLPVVPIEPEGDKMTRLYAVSGLYEGGMVYYPDNGTDVAPAWQYDYESEIFGYPLTTFKDQVDSTSQLLRWAHNNRSDGSFSFASSGRRAGHSMD